MAQSVECLTRDRGFEPHQRHCPVSLSNYINPSLVLVQPRKTRPFITEILLMGLCILYLGYGSKKLFKIMMNIAWLNLAFFVIMSNFFPNTLYEIYLDVFIIGEV